MKEKDYKMYVKILLKIELNIQNPDLLEIVFQNYEKDNTIKHLFNDKFYEYILE